MRAELRPVFKVCCIRSEEELRAAHQAGATFAGLVGPMPSGPGTISDARIARLVAAAPEGLTPVLLTSEESGQGIVDHVKRTRAPMVQLVRHLPADVRQAVRAACPGVGIIQVLHVEGSASVAKVASLATGADILLLDSGRPGASVAELGGTGRTHDWVVSAEIVRSAPIPVLLAGGLTPENAGAAVAATKPWGVDVCSGLRDADGHLRVDRLGRLAAVLGAAGEDPAS